jgi:F0F1-type ATP synthase membrane subunit a
MGKSKFGKQTERTKKNKKETQHHTPAATKKEKDVNMRSPSLVLLVMVIYLFTFINTKKKEKKRKRKNFFCVLLLCERKGQT